LVDVMDPDSPFDRLRWNVPQSPVIACWGVPADEDAEG